MEEQIRFDDGATYESFMGRWSQLVGERFLQWLAPAAGGRWIDVGCGNGAFTELLVGHAAPASVLGVDPAPGQIDYARGRMAHASVAFEVGGAEALDAPDATFDAAVMALVIFFVPDPARGVAEMVRVVRPGGSVSAYAWDIGGGGFPYAPLHQEMAALGMPPLLPPRSEVASLEALRALWEGAGLLDVQTCELVVSRTFSSFEEYWQIARGGPGIAPRASSMSDADRLALQARLVSRLAPGPDGRIVATGRAHAVMGRRAEGS